MLVDEIKKRAKKKRQNQASLGELCKPKLISKTRNLLNYRSLLN
jgi:hypothetical protein